MNGSNSDHIADGKNSSNPNMEHKGVEEHGAFANKCFTMVFQYFPMSFERIII